MEDKVTEVSFNNRQYHLQNDMISWCEEHIGMNAPYRNWVASKPNSWGGMGRWCVASAFGNTYFYFRDEADATAFMLRWIE